MMEDLLLQLAKDSSGNKYSNVKAAAQDANDFLESQQCTLRAAPHELREKCLNAFRLALHSNNNKLISSGVNGLQKLLRDDRFHSNFECENELQWLPTQMLYAIGSIQDYSDDIQVAIVKVLLNMVCTNWWTMNSKMIQQIFQLCLDSYVEGGAAVRTAAQATSSQTLRSFCNFLNDEIKSQQKNPFQPNSADTNEENIYSIFDDIIPVFNYLCKKLDEYQKVSHTKEGTPLVFLLEAMLTIVSCLPEQAKESTSLRTFLWQKFCPSLIAFLGSPRTDKNIVSSKTEGDDMGRGSGCLATAPTVTSAEAKMVNCIAIKLVELVGSVSSLRPMLESLFHRMLLYPPPQHRLEAIKALKEILKNPDLLVKFSGPTIEAEDNKKPFHSDLSLLTLVMDSIVECSRCNDNNVCHATISCIVAILGTLEELCLGHKLTEHQIEIITKLYKDLPSSDYTGPLTYRSREEIMKSNEPKDKAAKGKREKRKVNRSSSAGSLSSRDVISSPDEDTGYQGDQEDADLDTQETVNNNDDDDDDDAGELSSANSKIIYEDIEPNGNQSTGLKISDVNKLNNHGDSNASKSSENNDSESSGLTEGPEDDNYVENDNDLDDSLDEAVKRLVEQEAARREKLSKKLLGEETGRKEREHFERLCEARNEFAQLERYNGRHFVNTLKKVLPDYLAIRSSIEADEALQSFASKYCEGIYNQSKTVTEDGETLIHITIVNADGVYLATYSALLLNLKLIRSGYYNSGLSSQVPLSEEHFVEEVHSSGVLVYLSTIWLAELYQQVLQSSFLEDAGYKPNSTENYALINLLTGLELDEFASIVSLSDLDGLGNNMSGDQLLSDYRRLEKAACNLEQSPPIKAGMRISRRLLTACWNSIMEVLAVLLSDKSVGMSSNIGMLLGMEAAKEEHRKARESIAMSLEGLQKAARLCNILGLQSRCGSVFALLANASCPMLDTELSSGQKKKKKSATMLTKTKKMQLHLSHVLSMEVLLSRGLELGSHSPDCWRHVFRCCVYVGELEHNYFCQLISNNSNSQSPLAKMKKGGENSLDNSNVSSDGNLSSLQITPPMDSTSTRVNLLELLQQNNAESSSGVIANNDLMVKIICGLSQQIDKLFDDSASKLNLQALSGFLTELCASSQNQLYNESTLKKPIQTTQLAGSQSGVLLLYRLGDVMLKCVRSGRPLIHTMKAWSIVGPHFMEAACSKDTAISKKAVTCIHDIVTTLLSLQSELPYFHFNEALFKPFENLLCLELCDIEIQDQIISSICEFVEGSTTEIRSAWRPLFGALRAVRLSAPLSPTLPGYPSKNIHVQVVTDVFEAFLSNDNVLVFANAAVDCILCLLKHVRGISEPNESEDKLNQDNFPNLDPDCQDLCLSALKYVHRCSTILSSMYNMPACPIFFAANRIQLNAVPQMVDPVIPNMELIQMDQELTPSPAHLSQVSQDATEVLMRLEKVDSTLDNMDMPSGILHVWFLLLEGLGAAVSTCERKYQPYTMESLFVHLRGLYDSPGPQFGVYCINHLLLPMLQSWLRRNSRIYRGWDNYAPNFKQCCGLATDLVVDYITKLSDACLLKSVPGVNLMLKQLMLVMIECVAQPTESISRLGCACLRHVVVSACSSLNADLWEIACLSLHRACTVSLHSLYQLMEAFHPDSDNFYGDIGLVRVATRKDCTVLDAERLKQLAHQVFLLDSQRSSGVYLEPKEEEDRSYVFLLCPSNVENTFNPDLYVIRVSFKSLVVGVLSHLILLQTIGTLLLQGSNYIVPSLANVLLTSPAVTPSDAVNKVVGSSKTLLSTSKKTPVTPLPGILPYLSKSSLKILLDCLNVSYSASRAFDLRPGLKFLVQKVAQADVAANLYKQAGASWTIRMMTLFHLVLSDRELSLEKSKTLLTRKQPMPKKEKDAEETNDTHPLVRLKLEFSALCELYVDLILDKNGQHSHADKISDQPLFFLVAQPDHFPDIKGSKKDDEDEKTEKTNGDELEPKDDTTIVHQPPITKRLSMDSNDSDPTSSGQDSDNVVPECKQESGAGDAGEDGESSKVYSVATQRDIESVVQEYKRHKNQFSMPSGQREKRKSVEPRKSTCEAISEEMLNQKKDSIMKDSEAHIKVCSEMLLSIFDLQCQLDDGQFRALLPAIYPSVCVLVAYAQESTLRQTLTEYLQRISTLYQFAAD